MKITYQTMSYLAISKLDKTSSKTKLYSGVFSCIWWNIWSNEKSGQVYVAGNNNAVLYIYFAFYIVAYFHSDIFSLLNGLPGVVILGGSVIVVMKLLFYTKLERSELHKFSSLLSGIYCLLVGETLYFYQQYFLQISIPYPSVAEVPYLLANLFFSYFLILCLLSLINRKDLNPFPIILVSSLAIFPIYLILSSAYNFGINESSELEFIVNSFYYAFDALMLVPALVILLNLKKKTHLFFIGYLLQ